MFDHDSTPIARPESPLAQSYLDRAHSARVYDYLLGGKDNYAADRAVGDAAIAVFPGIKLAAAGNRAFMHRAVEYFSRTGISQFLDIGTGIPSEPDLHQIAQAVSPSARIVYVDNDPVVVAHAAALMVGDPRGRVACLQADARDPASILDATEVTTTLDLARPIAVSMIALLHFLDDTAAVALLSHLLDVLAPGSYIALTHGTFDYDDGSLRSVAAAYESAGIPTYLRSRSQIQGLFLSDVDVVDPGLVATTLWLSGSDQPPTVDYRSAAAYAAVARTRADRA